MTIFMQITLAAITGSAGLLAAATLPWYRPATDDTVTRLFLSMTVTIVVMSFCLPPLFDMSGANGILTFIVGSCFTMGMLQFILKTTPHRQLAPGLLEARKPRGYWIASLMVRRVEVMV